MEEKDLRAEERIMDAAAHVFMEKGKAGARMQEIADKAGINKALLHYYYRSKDQLYETVFTLVAKKLLIPKVIKILEEESDIFELIRKFTRFYVEVLNKNSFLPFFIIEDIHKNPGRLSNVFINSGLPIDKIVSKINNASSQGFIREIDPRQLIINMISLCVFPIIARNMMQPVLFQNNSHEYNTFLESRAVEVSDFIIHSIQISKP